MSCWHLLRRRRLHAVWPAPRGGLYLRASVPGRTDLGPALGFGKSEQQREQHGRFLAPLSRGCVAAGAVERPRQLSVCQM